MWMRRVVWALVVGGLLLPVLASWALRRAINDGSVATASSLFPPDAPKVVMCAWAHPDDEITSAGTLARMAGESGARLVLVYLTRGERAKVEGKTAEEVGREREAEARAAGRVLGAEEVVVLGFPDGGLPGTDAMSARGAIGELIGRVRPSVVVTFDENVGFYGHPDHAQVGRWVREVVGAGAAKPEFPVRRLYQATLPGPMIDIARKHVDAFRKRYPQDPGRGLPAPTVAVRITPVAATKRALLDVHKSQAGVVRDVQPYYDRLPSWLYYRILDREYFALALER